MVGPRKGADRSQTVLATDLIAHCESEGYELVTIPGNDKEK